MKRIYRSIFYIGLTLAVLSCKENTQASSSSMSVSFTKEGTAELFKKEMDSSFVQFEIEFARTEYETQTGLMYRNSMESNQGMLFIFEDASPRFFYMKNTRIPLDIIYLSEDQTVVSFIKEAQPYNENSLPSNEPAKYVLEINGGLIEILGIEIGDRLEFKVTK